MLEPQECDRGQDANASCKELHGQQCGLSRGLEPSLAMRHHTALRAVRVGGAEDCVIVQLNGAPDAVSIHTILQV